MKNPDVLSPASVARRPKYDRNYGSEQRSTFFQNENHLLCALRKGTVELNSFVENDYHRLAPVERMKAFEIISDASFANKHSIDYTLLNARFNPKNQYRVKTLYAGKGNVYECFMFEGKFHTGAELFLKESNITEVVRIAWRDRFKYNT